MGNQDLAQLKNLFDQAFEMDPQERERFLKARGSEEEEAASLLADLYSAETDLADFLEKPALHQADALFQEIDAEPPVRFQIDRYMVERELGRGGMGVVYLASRADDAFEKKVALKLVWPGLSQAEKRFRQERQILADLDHPNIARLMDGGSTNEGWQFLVMEYVDGTQLTTYCQNHSLGIEQRLQLFLQICDAVDHAHRNSILHRDIKPGNVLVTEKGQVKLLDFGIAKIADASQPNREMTVTGVRLLTPEYASPEQILGQPLTESSDIYSLGLVAFELLSGSLPNTQTRQKRSLAVLNGRDELPLMSAYLKQQDSFPPGFPVSEETHRKSLLGELDAIVSKALKWDPSERYLTVAELAADVRAYLEGRPLASEFPNWHQRSRKWVLRNKRLTALLAALFIVLVICIYGVGTQELERQKERQISGIKEYASILQQVVKDWDSGESARVADSMSLLESSFVAAQGLEMDVVSNLTNRSDITLEVPFQPERVDLYADAGRFVVSSADGQRMFLRQSDLQPLSYFVPGSGEGILLGDFGKVSLFRSGRRCQPFEIDSFKTLPAFDLASQDLQTCVVADTDPLQPLLVWLDGQNVIRICSFSDGRELRHLQLPGKPSTWFFSDDTSQLAAIIDEKTVVAIRTYEDIVPATYQSEFPVTTGWFIGPGRVILGGQGQLYYWVVNEKSGVRRLQLPNGAASIISTACPPGFVGATLDNGSLALWDSETLRLIKSIPAVAYKANGLHLKKELPYAVVYRQDGVANIVDISQGKQAAILKGHSKRLNTAFFVSDGQTIISSSEDRTVRKWDLKTVLQPTEVQVSTARLYSLDMKPDGSLVAVGGNDGQLVLVDPDTGIKKMLEAHRGIIYNLAFSKDGKYLISCAEDGSTILWDTASWKVIRKYQTGGSGYKGQIRSIEYLADGRRAVLAGNDGVIRVWSLENGDELHRFVAHPSKEILTVKLSPDGKQLASGSADGVLKLWNTDNWKEQAVLRAHDGRLWTIGYSPDGKELATGSGDQLVKIWRVADLAPLATLTGHTMGIFKLIWYPDGKGLVTVSDDKSIRFWNRSTGLELLALKSHTDEVWGLAISRDASKIVTGGFDGTLRVWRTRQSQRINTIPPAFKLRSGS